MLSSECDETVVYGVRQKLEASKKPTEALRLPGTPQKGPPFEKAYRGP